MKQPKWIIDEIILALDVYFEIGDVRKITLNNPLVLNLSSQLREMPFYLDVDSNFRNISGVRMILYNIASLDNHAKYHLGAATLLQKHVYSLYNNSRIRLKRIASAIKACLPLPFAFYYPLNFINFDAGYLLYLYHFYIENRTKIASFLVKDNLKRNKTICECCGVDLSSTYSERGADILELHYAEDITTYHNEMDLLPSNFYFLCANCHKIAHLQSSMFKMDNMTDLINNTSGG